MECKVLGETTTNPTERSRTTRLKHDPQTARRINSPPGAASTGFCPLPAVLRKWWCRNGLPPLTRPNSSLSNDQLSRRDIQVEDVYRGKEAGVPCISPPVDGTFQRSCSQKAMALQSVMLEASLQLRTPCRDLPVHKRGSIVSSRVLV